MNVFGSLCVIVRKINTFIVIISAASIGMAAFVKSVFIFCMLSMRIGVHTV